MVRPQPTAEADILKDIVGANAEDMTPEVAQWILQWKFSREAMERMNHLAARNRQDAISDAERDELE